MCDTDSFEVHTKGCRECGLLYISLSYFKRNCEPVTNAAVILVELTFI